MANVRITINERNLGRLLRTKAGPVVRHVDRIMRNTRNQAKRNVRVDEGTLRASIDHTVDVQASRIIGRCGTPLAYGYYLQRGTGIYGPRGKPIVPVKATVLRFEVKERTGKVSARGRRPIVFARSVRGVRGDGWLTRAFIDACPYPVRVRDR